MKQLHFLVLTFLSGVLLSVIAAFVTAAEPHAELKVGVLLCLSGECSEWGKNSLRAIELAAAELNASGGVLGRKVKFSVQDSREAGMGANSVTGYRQLTLDPEVKFIIGPSWSVGGLPLAPIIAARKDIIVTSPSLGVATFNETADNIFNTWPHDSFATAALAKYAIDNGWKRVAIFSGNDPWVTTQGDTFEKELVKLGGTVAIKVEVNPRDPDIRTEATRIKQSNPDAVFYCDTYNMGKAARELRNLKYSGPQLAIHMDETRMEEAQGAFEGTIFAMYPEASKEFGERFKKRYGEKPGITADTAYDAMMVYARAITAANSFDPEVVKHEILKADFQGASGRVLFDQKGGVLRAPVFWRVRNRSFELVK